MTTTETAMPTLAEQQAAGLRALADLIEANPELAEDISYSLKSNGVLGMPQFTSDVTDQKARLAAWARAGKAHGAKIGKGADNVDFEVTLDFGAVGLKVIAEREKVCERVVTGTEKVTKKVKDPAKLAEVPEIEVTETVEKVEWVCSPLLAADTAEVNAR